VPRLDERISALLSVVFGITGIPPSLDNRSINNVVSTIRGLSRVTIEVWMLGTSLFMMRVCAARQFA